MPYNIALANRVREYLFAHSAALHIEEKEMFSGLAFLVNGKMCVNVSGDNLMCRFDPALRDELAERQGYLPMVMKGREYKGYCYVSPDGFTRKPDFEYWLNRCLDFNKEARASKRRKNPDTK